MERLGALGIMGETAVRREELSADVSSFSLHRGKIKLLTLHGV